MFTKKTRGFTLLEILIALFIFTFVALIMTKALHSILSTQETTEAAAERLTAMQTALLLLSRDLEQTIERPISNSEGRIEGAFIGKRESLTFTHGGFMNPNGIQQSSSMQRTRYRFEKNQLIRDSWEQLDLAPHAEPHSRVLLTDIKDLQFRYLDGKNVFQTFWPPDGNSEAGVNLSKSNNPLSQALDILHNAFSGRLPRAVEMNLTLKQGGSLQQTYLLPQREVPHEPH